MTQASTRSSQSIMGSAGAPPSYADSVSHCQTMSSNFPSSNRSRYLTNSIDAQPTTDRDLSATIDTTPPPYSTQPSADLCITSQDAYDPSRLRLPPSYAPTAATGDSQCTSAGQDSTVRRAPRQLKKGQIEPDDRSFWSRLFWNKDGTASWREPSRHNC